MAADCWLAYRLAPAWTVYSPAAATWGMIELVHLPMEAEGNQSMSDLLALYRIQELELDIIARTERIKSINVEMAGDAALVEARASFETAQATHQDAVKRATEHEHEIRAVVEKRANSEATLYGGAVTNPKELQDLQMEFEALSRRKLTLDDEMLHLILERDDLGEKLAEIQAGLDEMTAAREEANIDLQEEKDELTAAVNELLAERKSQVTEVSPDLFQAYIRMRKPKANRPLAALQDKACTSCGIEQNVVVINAINRGDGIVHCQNCGRILLRL
ncbi:MAG: hypothetical protein F4Y70_04605 [Chloroflexi bacterium]|nr:hypothetical protein [Chloroflexota bacterium]MXX82738.1 hypothetical protein [Chloroflexota bacterium]MYA94780.1 hypothetical protein [Chloroflexota bacterium]MYC56569.1 hypothetical protein [Chloroflexota bacterium]MYD38774.1 hypothetical protein [Chloroflexota bacterium]